MTAGPIAIAGGLVLAGWDAEPAPGTVLVADGRIAAVAVGADASDLARRAAEVVDASGAVVMPGLVNAHHHAYGNAFRGTENSRPLEQWAPFTVAYGRRLDAETLRLAILLGAAEMLRGGITAAIDHSPQVGLHEAAFAAHRESGMRVGYAPFFHDIHDHDFLGLALPPALRAFLEAPGFPKPAFIEAMFRRLAAEAGDRRVSVLLGPNAPQRCSAVLLDLWVRLRDELGLGVHTHLLETRVQADGSRRAWWHGLVREMDRRGLLAPGLSVAHGVWLDAAERGLLAERGVAVAHNPASNLMLGSGLAPLQGYRRAGVTVALGSDSANSGGAANLFEVMRLAMMLPRLGDDDWRAWLNASDVLRMATEGGAAVLGLGGRTGRVAPGYLADLTLLDLGGSATIAARASVAALVQHGGPEHVRATMVDGRWAWRDGRIQAFDEATAIARFRDRIGAVMAAARDDVAMLRIQA